MEFLVEFDVHVPDGASVREVIVRYSADASAAARQVAEGHLVRVWRPPVAPGEIKTLGLYRAHSVVQLTGLLGASPLYDWVHVAVTHPARAPSQPSRTPGNRRRSCRS